MLDGGILLCGILMMRDEVVSDGGYVRTGDRDATGKGGTQEKNKGRETKDGNGDGDDD